MRAVLSVDTSVEQKADRLVCWSADCLDVQKAGSKAALKAGLLVGATVGCWAEKSADQWVVMTVELSADQ